MKITAVKSPALCSGLPMATVSLGMTCFAQPQGQEQQPVGTAQVSASEPGSEAAQSEESNPALSVGNSHREAETDR
jgi:nicotinamide mononucleotide (NMN) deamidase PncC